MAMAITSTMAPAAALPRRRRAPLESEEEEDVKQQSTRPNVRFARFDDQLQDSDQTITGGGGGGGGGARLPVARRRFDLAWSAPPRTTSTALAGRLQSSFFPDSTDDEQADSRGDFVLAPRQRSLAPTAAASTPTPTFPVIHIGDVQFPVTRTVLWDRRVLAGTFELSTAHVLPRVVLANSVLRQLHTLAVDASRSNALAPRLLGYTTTGDAVAAAGGGRHRVTLSELVHQKPARAAPWSVAFSLARSSSTTKKENAESIATAARAAYKTSGASSSSGSNRRALALEARGVVALSSERSRAEMDVHVDAVVPRVRLQLHLIRSLPLLMTPLAASLLRCEFGAETLRFGYLTLDRARKAVPLLETDPIVLQRPIVGLWVYGVDVDDPSDPEAMRVHHPFLFESCVRFLSSKLIKERAQVDADTFLLAVYPGSAAGPLPRFFECRVLRPPGSSAAVEWTSCSAHGRCLAGVSSFKSDLELTLVMAPEEVSTDLFRPVMSTNFNEDSTGPQTPPLRSLHEYERAEREYAATEARTNRRTTNNCGKEAGGAEVHVDEDPAAKTEPIAPMQSCCHSQQLLASQHQQLLENQQRQLREFQEQIAQLQRILTDTQAENARLIAASNSRSSGSARSSVGDGDAEQGQDDDDRATDDRDFSSALPQNEDDVGFPSEKHELQREVAANDESMGSSLALSSISQRSDVSDLSSVSSSVVGARLKSLLTSAPAEQEASYEQAPENAENQTPEAARGTPTVDELGHDKDLPRIFSPLEDTNQLDDLSNVEFATRRSCPFRTPTLKRGKSHPQCERDEFDDESDASKIDALLAERLRVPVTPNREEIVRGGTLATIGFSHGSSFSIPKIKFVPETVTCDSDEDEADEIRRIELKYRMHRVH